MDKKLLISDIYKDNELNLEFSDLIKDCFEFGIFKNKPSKSFKDWFKSAYDHDYPVVLEDLKPKLVKQLKRTIKARKNEKKLEEKWKKQRAERGFSDCDSWNIFSWFLEVMTPALKQMRENLSGYPTHISNSNSNSQALQVDEEDEPGMVEWKRTLDRMIFLLQEMNEDTCSYKNPYEAEVNKAQNAFTKKYGFFGEGLYDLLTSEEEKERDKNNQSKRMFFYTDDPDHPEYKELRDEYYKYEASIANYRDKCREEFFQLFSLHFWDLWD